MPEFRVIVVPYELGRLRHGVGRGPERLLSGGAVEALASAGADVRVDVVEFDESFERTGYGEVDASFDLIRVVAERVRDAVAGGAFPVLLSGSCFNGVGVVAGLGEPHPGVVWLDAHSDFNSPGTAISGYFDGMGLAILTGGAWPALHATVPGGRPLPETSVVLAGARDFEPPEPVRLAASELRQVDASGHGDARRATGRDPVDWAPADRHLPAPRPRRAQRGVAGVNVFSAPGGPRRRSARRADRRRSATSSRYGPSR